MTILMRLLALLGFGTTAGIAIALWSILAGPTQCTLTGAPIRYAEPQTVSTANRDMVIAFYRDVLLDHHLDRAKDFLKPDYIQHNPRVGQGQDGFVAYFEALNAKLAAQGSQSHGEITLAAADGDLVTLHVTTVIDGTITASFRSFDTFRVADGKIAEHWDVIQPCDLRSTLLMAVSG